jgi:SAM-dependent methyltransferase
MHFPTLCPLCCNGTQLGPIFQKAGLPIFRCPSCGAGVAFAEHFDASAYYDSSYFNGDRSDGYSDYIQAAEVLRAQFRRELILLDSLGAHGGQLLELGCAYGYFLDMAADTGFRVCGLELCQEAVDSCNARGHHDVYRGEVSNDALSKFATADVVVMLDVIEHLPDPVASLEAAADKLQPGGLILITTGDFSSLFAKMSGRQWRLMTPPQHLWFFTPQSLRALGQRLGLELIHLDHPWKKVPVGLVVYQLCRYFSLKPSLPRWMHHVGIPVNLFDAMRLVFRKQAAS